MGEEVKSGGKGREMKVSIKTDLDEDGYSRVVITVDGRVTVEMSNSVLLYYPEDLTLDRRLDFIYDIPSLMKMAYEVGKRGESFVIEEVDIRD